MSVTERADDADTNRRDMDVVERSRGYFESSCLTRLAGRLRCRSIPTPRESTGQRPGRMQTMPANGARKNSALRDTANTPFRRRFRFLGPTWRRVRRCAVHHHLDAEIISYVVTQASLARSTRLSTSTAQEAAIQRWHSAAAIRLMQLRAKLAFPPTVAQSAER